jgi:hypothetical protein
MRKLLFTFAAIVALSFTIWCPSDANAQVYFGNPNLPGARMSNGGYGPYYGGDMIFLGNPRVQTYSRNGLYIGGPQWGWYGNPALYGNRQGWNGQGWGGQGWNGRGWYGQGWNNGYGY